MALRHPRPIRCVDPDIIVIDEAAQVDIDVLWAEECALRDRWRQLTDRLWERSNMDREKAD